jgi:hypothetical protein
VAQEHQESLHHPAQQLDIARARRPTRSVQVKPDDASTPNLTSLSNFEVFTGITIPPGQTLTVLGTLDWTGASTASIAMSCPASTSLQNTAIVVYWQMPSFTNLWTGTSGLLGSGFLFSNMGGGVVPVFGNFFGLQVTNAGSTTVACDQLTVYGVVH